MRRSARLAVRKTNLENDARKEMTNAKKYVLNVKKSKIAALDNGTMVETFKYLDYCQLAKKSLVSKRFRNVIQAHRHTLPLLYVSRIEMYFYGDRFDATQIEMFNQELSTEAYDQWVICTNYSKQFPLENQSDCDVYALYADCEEPNQNTMTVLYALAEFNHENWPLFQHFVRLLSDLFVYIDSLELATQNDVLNLLAGEINQDRLRCKALRVDLYGNTQKFIYSIKDHVCCDKFYISDCMHSNNHQGLLNFFVIGGHCTSAIYVEYHDFSNHIVDFVKKFLDLKNCDEYQLVQYIVSVESGKEEIQLAHIMKQEYPEFIVKEEHNEEIHDEEGHVCHCCLSLTSVTVFAFNNDDIEKKMLLTFRYFNGNLSKSHFSLNIEDL